MCKTLPVAKILKNTSSMIALLFALTTTVSAQAATQDVYYGGRLLNTTTGAPIAGPIDIRVQFFASASGGAPLGAAPTDFSAVALQDGVFELRISLGGEHWQQIFAGRNQIWIEITDITNNITYPRQEFGSVPFALRVPVDGTTVTFDPQGKLKTLLTESDPSVQTFAKQSLPACAPDQVLRSSGGNFTCATIGGGYSPHTHTSEEVASGTLDVSRLPASVSLFGSRVDNTELQGISSSCAIGKTIKANGSGGFFCDDDANTVPNPINVAATGALMDAQIAGTGLVRKTGAGTYSADPTPYLSVEADPSVSSFAKQALPNCTANEALSNAGAALACVPSAKPGTNSDITALNSLTNVPAVIQTAINNALNAMIPTGTLIMSAAAAAPAGYLACDGATVSRTTYAALFTALGTQYGAGDGSTTFKLPDCRSRVVVGAGQGTGLSNYTLGQQGGEEAHALSVAELASHGHVRFRFLRWTKGLWGSYFVSAAMVVG